MIERHFTGQFFRIFYFFVCDQAEGIILEKLELNREERNLFSREKRRMGLTIKFNNQYYD